MKDNFKRLTDFIKQFADNEVAPEKVDVLLEGDAIMTVDKLEKDGVAMIGTDLVNPGEYKTQDGKIIVVGDNGKITEVKEGGQVEEPEAEIEIEMSSDQTEMEKELSVGSTLTGEVKLADGTMVKLIDGKIDEIVKEEEKLVEEEEVKVEENTEMKEFNDRLEILEEALFKFFDANKKDMELVRAEIKKFSEQPAPSIINQITNDEVKEKRFMGTYRYGK